MKKAPDMTRRAVLKWLGLGAVLAVTGIPITSTSMLAAAQPPNDTTYPLELDAPLPTDITEAYFNRLLLQRERMVNCEFCNGCLRKIDNRMPMCYRTEYMNL